MKHIFVILLSFCCTLSGMAQSTSNDFELTIKFNGYPKEEKLSLGRYYQSKQYYVDSAVYDQKKDAYVFKGEKKEPGMYMLITFESQPFELIIDKDQKFSVEISYPNLNENIIYKNTPDNQVYQDFNNTVRPYYMAFEEIRKKYDSLEDKKSPEAEVVVKEIQAKLDTIEQIKSKFMTDNPSHLMTAVFKSQKDVDPPLAPDNIPEEEHNMWRYNYFVNHYFDNIDLADDRLIRTPMFHQRLETYIGKVLPPHPDSIKFALERLIEKTRGADELFKYTIWYAVDHYQRSQIIGYDAIWVYLAKKYYLSGDAFWATPSVVENFRKRIERLEPLLIGNVPVEFYCPDTNADRPNERWRSIFEPKSRYSIIIFWEPGCGHCRKQMPILRDFYKNKGKELDFEVVAICKDHNLDTWRKYIDDNDMASFINLSGKASNINYDDIWDVSTTPTIYVLDSKKRVVTKKVDVDQIQPFIENWNELYYK